MKKSLLVLALLASFQAHATDRSPLTGNTTINNDTRSSAGAIASTGNSDASGGSNDLNFLALPSTTSATATSGNVPIVCQVITVVSEANQVLFGLHSKSEIGVKPARVNFVCVLYHNAVQSGKPEDWKRFVDYAEEQAKAQAEAK